MKILTIEVSRFLVTNGPDLFFSTLKSHKIHLLRELPTTTKLLKQLLRYIGCAVQVETDDCISRVT